MAYIGSVSPELLSRDHTTHHQVIIQLKELLVFLQHSKNEINNNNTIKNSNCNYNTVAVIKMVIIKAVISILTTTIKTTTTTTAIMTAMPITAAAVVIASNLTD